MTTGLVSSPAPPIDPDALMIAADGWFPAVPASAVRDVVRLGDGVVTTARLIAAMEGAMLHALRELSDWRSGYAAAGVTGLSGVTDATINGKNYAVLLWTRIVRHFAAADLLTGHRDVSATETGLDRAAEKLDQVADHRRLALAAVADLRSIGGEAVARNAVDLI